MTSQLREERVQELCESAYGMLKESHGALHELKGLVDRLHTGYLQQQKTPDFDTISAIKLTTDRMYGELERYLRPECDPDSAYDAAMTEKP
ncbi:MAG: hypothetical protein A2075_02570 [Geobacteraceae bacterium GWC2_58_44]|nr:MAG: hypothetical protein A2075_02570 [Geobacteraceae bacterium GWC2_58_44]HBG04007.1 hypothetical protein [Geobacter sp.]